MLGFSDIKTISSVKIYMLGFSDIKTISSVKRLRNVSDN